MPERQISIRQRLNRRVGPAWLAVCVWLLPPVVTSAAGDLKLPLLWQTDLQSLLESAATVGDVRGQGREEIVVAGREELFILDGHGKELWHWRTKGRFMTYPAVLARPGQPSLIFAADNGGLLTCLDGTGKEVWQAPLKGPSSWSAAVVCDLDGDGAAEVIQTDETGTVWGFAALTGKMLWQAQVKGAPASPAVGDLDGDGKPEIVVATGEGIVTAIKGTGQPLWSRNVGGSSPTWATSAPVIFGGSGGRGRVAAASSEGRLFCLDRGGEILWWRPTRGAAASTISVGDLGLDGRADLCLITQLGVIHRFEESGRPIWEIDTQGRSLAAGAMIDLDGDGELEYALCTQAGLMLVLNNQGEFLHRHQFNHRTINVTPAFGDVAAESPGLEMVVTGGESGMVCCFSTPAATNALAHWRGYRGDARNSGSWFGLRAKAAASVAAQKMATDEVFTNAPMTSSRIAGRITPEKLAGDEVFTGEDVRFVIHAPEPPDQPLTATAVCIRPDGARQAATTVVLGTRGELLMPVDAVVPGTYRFTWTLEDAGGRALASGEQSVFLQPFANDRALAGRALEALRAAADGVEPKLPLSANALRHEGNSLANEAKDVAPLQEASLGGEPGATQSALAKTSALVRRARRAARLADLARQAGELGPGTSLIAFEGTTWENRRVDEQLPAAALNLLQIRRVVVPGEHDPVALNLFNVTDRELLVRVHLEPTTNGIVVTPHRSVGVPTSLGEVAWDALPEVDESATLSVPPLASRELWLDVDLGGAKPGERRLKVRLQALNGAGVLEAVGYPRAVPPPETRVEIAFRVLPFALAPAGEFRLCTWGAPDAAQVADLLAHGNNVFCAPLPEPQYDAQARLTGGNYAKLDAVLARLSGHDVILLLTGLPGLRGAFGGAAYQRELKLFLDDLVGHLAGLGLDTNHFALYPFDEPGGAGWSAVRQLVEFSKLVRAANPRVMIYVDGGGELPMFQALAPYVDIWCPGIYMLPDKSPLMDLVRHTGKMLWSYNCAYGYARPTGPNLKNMNLIGDYRAAALFAFRHGATGIGFWCYNQGGDPWGRIDAEYMLVYPGVRKPVTSRRWEAVREGIEDYRILAALRKHLSAHSGEQRTESARPRIQRLLEVSLPGLVDQSFNEMTRGLGRHVIDASSNDATIGGFRREMMECVEALSGLPAN